MKIRLAKQSDKSKILEFCQNTFSWGDYIEDAWDHWIKEGNLFILENDSPLGLAHAHLANNQVWIEGIRIHPQYRKKHYASKLIEKIENIAREKGKLFSFMLIDVSNNSSMLLAKKCRYSIKQTWKFYTLDPKLCNPSSVEFTHIIPEYITQYVKSWRWLPLDSKKIREFSEQKKLICSNQNKNPAYAILMDSSCFGKTLVVTFFSGNDSDVTNLLCYIQNFSYSKNYNRIELLTKKTLPNFDSLELKTSFHLFKKKLD